MITSKSRYALKVMMDLATHQEKNLEQRHDIASRQGIPLDYLDQILLRLRAGGLIESVRGRAGGFKLVIEPKNISVWDILDASEDSLYPVQCLSDDSATHGDSCLGSGLCTTRGPWEEIIGTVKQSLNGITLDDLARKYGIQQADEPQENVECRGPKKSGKMAPRKDSSCHLDVENG